MDNPALRRERLHEPAAIIPPKQEGSILDWLKANNRIIYREKDEDRDFEPEELLLEDEEISELLESEGFDLDEEDFEDLELGEEEEPDLLL
ncbi:MAG TPA: DUF3134 family protein [Geminocystis sp. M7585_C2015_104]|nr:DUF3134 family protein [Geminocystis sp. M7585_C2015_104]